MNELADKYFIHLAAAFVRGKGAAANFTNETLPDRVDEEALIGIIQKGLNSGLRLHKFKKTMGLQRVSRVLGVLRGLQPESLLDVGSGRGAFLWPLLNEFPQLNVTCIDLLQDRVEDILAVRRGGVQNLQAEIMSAEKIEYDPESFDVVTMLEVLEHMPRPEAAIQEGLRVARRAVIITVPSREDDNPEHIHLLGKNELEKITAHLNCRTNFHYVLNHLMMVAVKS